MSCQTQNLIGQDKGVSSKQEGQLAVQSVENAQYQSLLQRCHLRTTLATIYTVAQKNVPMFA